MSNDRRAALTAAMGASGDSTSPSASSSSPASTASAPAAQVTSPAPAASSATTPPSTATASAAPAPQSGSRLRGSDGKFAKDGATPPVDGKATDSTKPEETAEGTPTPAEAGQTAPEAPESGSETPKVKEPPPTIKGAVREEWANIPKVAQEELARQANMLGRLGRLAGESNKVAKGWQQVVAPFQKLMGNANPMQVAADLFQTAAALSTGTPEQKLAIVESLAVNNRIDVTPIVRKQLSAMPPESQAATLAAFIQEHKINPDLVADFLEGKRPMPNGAAPSAPAPQAAPQVPHDPRLDALLEGIQRSRQTKAQQEMAVQAKELEKFAQKAEFLEHRFPDDEDSPRGTDGEPLTIREYMADLAETAERQGRKPNLKNLYEVACKANPTVLKIMQQREAKAKAQAASTSVQRAQAAASSVRSEPVAARSAAPADRRSMLQAEFMAQRGR